MTEMLSGPWAQHLWPQGELGAVSLSFVHMGQDLEEQEELLECLLAFFTQYLLADDEVTCMKSGMPPSSHALSRTTAKCICDRWTLKL